MKCQILFSRKNDKKKKKVKVSCADFFTCMKSVNIIFIINNLINCSF